MIIGTLENGTTCVYDYRMKLKQQNNSKALYMATIMEGWQKASGKNFLTNRSY